MNLDDVVLEGRQCVLCAMKKQYIPTLVEYLNDHEINRYLRVRAPVTLEEQMDYFERTLQSERDAIFAVLAQTPHGRQFVGVIGLHEIDMLDKTARGGIIVGDKQFQGHGIGTEARLLKLKYAFRHLGLRWVFGTAIGFNEASKRVMLKTGYELVGVQREARFAEGAFHDNFLYAVSRESWERCWESYVNS